MEIIEINDFNTKHVTEAMKIYSESFPNTTRHPLNEIKEHLRNGQNRLFVALYHEEVIAFALIYRFQFPNFLLLDYYAVKEEYRNKGIGSSFLKDLFKKLRLEDLKAYLIFEVDDPNYGTDQLERMRRIQFYKMLNVVQILKMRYLFPTFTGTEGLEMILMIYPKPKENVITPIMLKNIIIRLYVDKYHRSFDDPLLNETLSFIPDKILYK